MTTTKQLHKLYQNRELLVFINGQEWFNEQVNVLHRKKAQFEKDVIILETIRSAKEYKFSKDQFDKLIDNQQDNNIMWPTVNVTAPVLILDRSPLLKYQDIPSICKIISQAAEKYHAIKIVVRHKLIFVDDVRTTDRFYNFHD